MTLPTRTLRTILLATTALVAASIARADQLPSPVAPIKATVAVPANAFDWSGFHIGVGGGWRMMRSSSRVNASVNQHNSTGYGSENYTNALSSKRNLNAYGGLATVDFGADQQFGKFVAGAFADLDFSSQKAKYSTTSAVRSTGYGGGHNANATLSHKVRLGDSVDLGGRFGFLATDKTLLYGLAGLSLAEIDASSTFSVTHGSGSILSPSSLTTSTNGWRPGLVIGGGVEQAITDKISIKLEYRYADYQTVKSSATSTAGGEGAATLSQEDHVTSQSVRAVLSYHF